MATEPSDADEALKLYNQLMKKENEILSTDKALWEKVFTASNKETPMIEDGTNYGDFLLKTIESAKDQFTDEEYKKLVAGAEQIKEIEGKLTILEQKYPECAKVRATATAFRLTVTALFQTAVTQQVFRHLTARTLTATM